MIKQCTRCGGLYEDDMQSRYSIISGQVCQCTAPAKTTTPAALPSYTPEYIEEIRTALAAHDSGWPNFNEAWTGAAIIAQLRTALADSERTVAELRQSVQNTVVGMNTLAKQSVEIVDENARLRARAEAAEAELARAKILLSGSAPRMKWTDEEGNSL